MSLLDKLDNAFSKAKQEDNAQQEAVENSSLTNENQSSPEQTEEVPQVEAEVTEQKEEGNESVPTQPPTSDEKSEVEDEKEEKAVVDSPNYDTYIAENGYKSKDEYEALKSEYEQKLAAASSNEIDDPLINTLIERKKAGLPIDANYILEQTTNYDALDMSVDSVATDIIKKGLMAEGMTEEEAALEIEYSYEFPEGFEEGDREYDRVKKKKTLDANKYKRKLKELQEANKLPESKEQKEFKEQQEEQQRQINTWRDDWSKRIPKELGEFNELKISNEDVGDIVYELSEQDKKFVGDVLQSKIIEGLDLNYTGRYFDETNRSWNVNQMINDELWGNSAIRERLINKVMTEVKAKGSDEVIDTIKNTKLNTSTETKEVSPKEDLSKKRTNMARQIMGM